MKRLCLVAFAILPCLLHAATYYVATSADGGNDDNDGLSWETAKASIQGAYALASDSVDDTILVTNGTYTLSAGLFFDKPCTVSSVNGAGSTTIYSAGAFNSCTISNAAARLCGFTLLSDYTSRAYIPVVIDAGTMDSCVVTNFFTTKEVLLCVNNRNSHNVANCVITGCKYNGTQRMISPNNATLLNCSFVNNILAKGYLMYPSGTTMRNCLVAGNVSQTSTAPFLVNIYSGTIHNCTFAGNKTTKTGAASYYAVNLNGKTFANCIFWGNTNPSGDYCDWGGGVGGATYCCSSTAGLTGIGCTTSDPNFADAANGDYHIGSGSCVDAGNTFSWMTTSTDLDGNARIFGDKPDIGCYEYVPGALECSALVDSSTFVGEASVTLTASVGGADLSNLTYTWAVTNLLNNTGFVRSGAEYSTLTETFAYGDYAVVLEVSNGSQTASFSVSPLFSVKPSVIYVAKGATPAYPYGSLATAFTNIVDAVAFSESGMTINVAEGVYTNASNVVLAKGVELQSIDGACKTAVYSADISSSAWTLSHGLGAIRGFTFVGDYSKTRENAVVAASAGTLADCIVTNFTTSGTIFKAAGACLFTNCVVYGCKTTGGWLIDLNFSGSMAVNCRFTGNTMAGLLTYLSSATLRNCLLADNTTSAGSPFIVNIYSGSGTIESCTIANNRTTSTDAGAYAVVASGTIRNTILWNNTLRDGGVRDWSGNSSVLVNCCSSTDGMTGAGCLVKDPCFKPGGYRLRFGSPCIDCGANQGWMSGATDLAGNPRIKCATVDIGCYEYVAAGLPIFVR
jgi:hypothetical protein